MRHFKITLLLFKLVAITALAFFFNTTVRAQLFVADSSYTSPRKVTLAWDPSPDTNAAGYICLYGFSSDAMTNRLDLGNVTSVSLAGMDTNKTYHFTVIAYSVDDLESLPSNELIYSPPAFYSQNSLVFLPPTPQVYATTNLLSVTGGSGSGSVSYTVASGPGLIAGGVNLVVTSGVGDVVVVASKAGDADYFPVSVTNTVSAAKASQTVTFPSINTQKTTNVVVLNATASSGLPVTYSVLSGPAVFQSGRLNFTGSGSVSVAAQQAGSTSYLAAPAVTNTFVVNDVVWPSLVLATNRLRFSAVYAGTNPPAQTLQISNTGEIGGDYSMTTFYGPGASNWFSTTLSNGIIGAYGSLVSTSQVASVLVAPGDYVATNILTSQTATNTPVTWLVQLSVAKAAQVPLTISISSSLNYGSTNLVTVSGGSGSGALQLQVVSGPATLVASNQLLITSGSGDISLRASKAGDGYYDPAEVTRTVTASPASQGTLVFQPVSPQIYFTTNTLFTTGGAGTGGVTYQVLDGPGVLVASNKLLVLSGVGTVHVAAFKAGDANYAATAATNAVDAAKASQTVLFTPIPSQKLTNVVILTASASSGLPVSFALVSGPGTLAGAQLSFTGPGTVAVAATQAGNTNYLTAPSVTNTIIVIKPLTPPSNLHLNQ